MRFTKESAVEHATRDLAKRLKIGDDKISEKGVVNKEFADMSLGTPEKGEMAAQMIADGWQIKLAADGKTYEYRGDKYQLRLHNFKGENYVVKS